MKALLYLISVISLFSCDITFGQQNNLFDKINELGITYVTSLKKGNIEQMKNVEPPKDTWTYKKLLIYKEQLSKSSGIKYGSFIMPTLSDNTYGFNFFAIDLNKKDTPYFFVAVVQIKATKDKLAIDNAFLFTERASLSSWWMRALSFYKDRKEDKAANKIPDKYVFPICPPPPYNYNED